MAAYFSQLKPVLKKIQGDFFIKSIGSVRYNSVKARKKGYTTRYGFKREHLSTVKTSGELLYNQRNLIFSPGLNVGLGSRYTLYAKVPGKVVVSWEKTNYKTDDNVVKHSFPMVYIMATQLPVTRRTQGDGMEKVENEFPKEQIVVLQPQEIVETVTEIDTTEKGLGNKSNKKNFSLAVKLTPHTIDRSKKDILSNLKNKEPKFVPYEPYKAAVRPIVPQSKRTIFRHGLKKKQDFVSLFNTNKSLSEEKLVKDEIGVLKDSIETLEIDWEGKYKGLESEIQTLREENKQLENQLKFQVQVNGELKNLLVAAVGEDMETKVHVLTEDKLHLAQALLKSAESLTTHQEQTEWLAGQCEVWRSKFLASSVMVEELARWKASLSQKVNEAHDVLKKLLEDGKQMRDFIIKTHRNLCLLRDNFDLHSRKNNLKGCNVVEVSEENLKLTEGLLLELLGSEKKPTVTQNFYLDHLKRTPAERSAEHVLSNPNILQLIGEPDAACNAVVGAAVTLSGQLYLQNHPPKIECCPQCSGEIKLI